MPRSALSLDLDGASGDETTTIFGAQGKENPGARRALQPGYRCRDYTYDSAGNRATEADARGVTRTMSHDALDRLTAIE